MERKRRSMVTEQDQRAAQYQQKKSEKSRPGHLPAAGLAGSRGRAGRLLRAEDGDGGETELKAKRAGEGMNSSFVKM